MLLSHDKLKCLDQLASLIYFQCIIRRQNALAIKLNAILVEIQSSFSSPFRQDQLQERHLQVSNFTAVFGALTDNLPFLVDRKTTF